MATKSQTITFNPFSPIEEGEYSISLDDDYNQTVYDVEQISIFNPGQTVYLKIFPPYSKESYTLESSFGTLSKIQTNKVFNIKETLNFVNQDELKLLHKPDSVVDFCWIGNNIGTPSFSEQKVLLNSKKTGILKCQYSVVGDRLKLVTPVLPITDCVDEDEGYDVLCLGIYSENVAQTTVKFKREETLTSQVRIIVRDVCTGDPIEGASVSIAGIGDGETNEQGVWQPLKELEAGKTYGIVTHASGYTSSPDDYLNNDSFVMPDLSEDEDD